MIQKIRARKFRALFILIVTLKQFDCVVIEAVFYIFFRGIQHQAGLIHGKDGSNDYQSYGALIVIA